MVRDKDHQGVLDHLDVLLLGNPLRLIEHRLQSWISRVVVRQLREPAGQFEGVLEVVWQKDHEILRQRRRRCGRF
jgi:hypothetical protein